MLPITLCLYLSLHYFGIEEPNCKKEIKYDKPAIIWASGKNIVILSVFGGK